MSVYSTAGLILTLILLLLTVRNYAFYRSVLKVKPGQWFYFNPSSIANISYIAGFTVYCLTKNRVLLNLSLFPMFLYGTMLLFFNPWNGMNIIAQLGNLIMTLNFSWVIAQTMHENDYKTAAAGLILGIPVYAWYILMQQNYIRNRLDEYNRVMTNASTAGMKPKDLN